MTTYSVAHANEALLSLLDRVLQGEEVIISRDGKAVAELRSLVSTARKAAPDGYAWLKARRQGRAQVEITSVDILNQLYEDPEVFGVHTRLLSPPR
jgi:antitoxin (DNA-binding transcriptional repressor) of toxin-antitoxin stability system